MSLFKKILVPVDFSPHAGEAIRYAADLSKRYEAQLTLVHVYQPVSYALPDGYVLYSPKQLSSMLAEFEKHLEVAKAQAQSAGATSVDTKMLQGIAFEEIMELAKQAPYDLIVMGTHGRTGIKRALMGSVTERVIRQASCPVLTVHAKT